MKWQEENFLPITTPWIHKSVPAAQAHALQMERVSMR